MGQVKIGFLKFSVYTAARHNHNRILEKEIDRKKMKGKLLDVGCGISQTYKTWFKKCEYESLDIDKNSRATHTMDITKQTPPKKYDIVTAFNVLEHVSEPAKALSNIATTLKKKGIFVGSVPFMVPIHAKEDYYRYTKQGLIYLLSKHFISIKIYPFGNRAITFLRNIATVKFLGLPFNLMSSVLEWIFQNPNAEYPTGYIFIALKK